MLPGTSSMTSLPSWCWCWWWASPADYRRTTSRWARRRDWAQLMRADRWTVAVGVAAGLAGLAIALVAGSPFVELMSGRTVEWSAFPVVRGSAS